VLTKEQLALELGYGTSTEWGLRDAAASENKVLPVHRWVPWIAGFSAQFVEDILSSYLTKSSRRKHLVLDPFAGVGTTLIEAIKAGHDTVGYEINPFAALAASAKLRCIDLQPNELRAEMDAFRGAMQHFENQVDNAWREAGETGVADLAKDWSHLRPAAFKSRIPFFSPPVEAKFLYALARVGILLQAEQALFRAAIGATMVSFSNYSYEPSLASRPGSGKPVIDNASVVTPVCRKIEQMLTDIEWVRQNYWYDWATCRREIVHGSYFGSDLPRASVSLIVTSPPYMNNYHYVRNTRPQLHWLGLLGNGATAELEQASFGKFWQTVRQGPAVELTFVLPGVREQIEDLRTRNYEKGYYGGSGWANYVATYLNDSYRMIKSFKEHLRPGGRAVIVVGNSIIQGMEFRIDQLLSEMAGSEGIDVEDVHIVRTKRVGNSIIDSSVRNGDANGHRGKTQLYDAAVVLRR